MMVGMMGPSFSALGDAALVVRTPLARELLLSLEARALPGVREVVPALGVLTVLFDPVQVGFAAVESELRERLGGLTPLGETGGRHLTLPVRFDGPDLAWCAKHSGQSVDALIAELCTIPFTVAFLGYTPGFAFLTGLPARLQMPRLAAPRERVAAGSVALGGPWAGVYPQATPGGWRIVGSTDVPLFDLKRPDPVWWHPGDVVRFERA